MKGMKNKIIIFLVVGALVFTSSIVSSTAVVNSNSEYNPQSNESTYEEHANGLCVLSDFSMNDEDTFMQTGTTLVDSKDQYCENGNQYYTSSLTSIYMAQSFKPSKNWFTKLNIYLKKSSNNINTGIFVLTIRNDTYNNKDWLGATGLLQSVSTSGGWLEIPCKKPFPMIPGKTYFIVIRLFTNLPSGESFSWRYGQGNPYSNGQAYISTDNGGSWASKSDWDFNFQTWGISTNPPNQPSGPSPANGATGVSRNADLSWSCSDPDGDPLTYDVYFGTGTPPPIAKTDYSKTSYDPGELLYGTTCHWKIVARDSNRVEKEGPIWNFRTELPPPGPAVVAFVETYYADGSGASDGKGLFLQGMDLKNKYTAFVVGNNVDKVEFNFGGQQYVDTNGADGWTATFDLKLLINPNPELKVRAHNDYNWGDYKTYTPKVIPMAGWLVKYINYIIEHEELDYVTFSIGERDSPPNPKNNYWTLEATVDFSKGDEDDQPVNVGVDCPVEKVGGKYSFSGGIGCSVIICSDGTIDVGGEFEAGVKAKSVGGSIGSTLSGHLYFEGNSIKWDYMYITINGEVTIPIFIIPLNICGIGIDAGIEITPSVEVTFTLEPTEGTGGLVPGLGIKLKDNGGIKGNVCAKVRAYGELGIVVADFYGEAGGSGCIYFRTPPSGSLGYLEKFVLSCWVGGRVRFLFWTAEGWWHYDWTYPSGALTTTGYEEQDWEPLDRDYVNPDQGVYNHFAWDNSENNNVGTIIENAFPYANPSTASDPVSAGTKVMVVWNHDNNNKPKVKGMEIWYTIWDKWEGTMDTPKAIPATVDNILQVDPKIAYDKNGNVICVFVQTESSISESSDINSVASATEIAYCIWNKNSKTWGNINLLTDDNKMDVSPVLSSNSNGDVILVWSSDGDKNQETIGDRTIYSSIWDGTSWSTPTTVVENKPVVTTPQVALKNQIAMSSGTPSAICVFSMDEDNNALTTDDQNVYYANINQGISSSDIIKFTDDNYQDASPSVVYGRDGNPYIIWLKNKYHKDSQSQQNIYDGTLYYDVVSNNLAGSSSNNPRAITTGSISDPRAISSQPSGVTSDNYNFAVGWGSGRSTQKLNWAQIDANGGIQSGTIYGSDSKLSETDWCLAVGGITATTMERPTVKDNNKNCDLTFIHAPQGFDTFKPVTSCSINGNIQGYGNHGPEFMGNVNVGFESTDETGDLVSGIYKTEYKLDNGAWETYTQGSTITVAGGNELEHTVWYRSVDKAGNWEKTNNQPFKIIVTHAPSRPVQPSGPTSGKPGIEYTFSTRSSDVDGDPIEYMWDWGDTQSGWMGPYPSGDTCSASHKWSSNNNYEVKVKAKDSKGGISDWSDPLTIKISTAKNKNKPSFFFNWLLDLLKEHSFVFKYLSKWLYLLQMNK